MNKPGLPLGRRNWILFGAGLACIAVGYVVLSVPPPGGFMSLTLAPILLVAGYCVLVPAAILVRDRQPGDAADASGAAAAPAPAAGRPGARPKG